MHSCAFHLGRLGSIPEHCKFFLIWIICGYVFFLNIADSRIRTGAPEGNMIVTWLLIIKSPNPSFQVFKYWLKQNLFWLINWKFVSVSITCKWTGFLNDINKNAWPRRDLNTQPSDLESDALPLRHGVYISLIHWFVDPTEYWKYLTTNSSRRQ